MEKEKAGGRIHPLASSQALAESKLTSPQQDQKLETLVYSNFADMAESSTGGGG
eukprot:CAMPEP_0197864228 /NCGR_PEP_ID=MMETSP1438-20131217/42318_1 /TAXON_ID=1461541 /ORGANISM="Pterosperma sp., Strain CCMP1384" /LENGTH=53 /DNA_ID=CAMNT_0043482395 /DNA_START=47 /DNA_END=204 /DNA_ORIENTATION=+